jgi:HAD superfamily hydrolase (TIGR01509 family)
MYQAVVFDMDGVIFDSEKLYRISELEHGKKYNFPEEKVVLLCERMAGGNRDSNLRHFEELFGDSGVDYDTYRNEVHAWVDRYAEEHGLELKPGVKELLSFLKERNVKIALATSTHRDRAEKHLKTHGIFDYFDEIVFGDMVQRGKPAPDIYLEACRRLGVEPECAIGVEDSINGVVSSGTAGLYTVMVVDLIQPNDVVRKYASQIYDVITDIEMLFSE